jgi:hypothetical protein
MSTTATNAEDPFAILGETLETAASSLEATTKRARASAHNAAATTKRVVGSGAYSISYALAYGAVFTATYLHDLMPVGSAVRRGFDDGTHDALTARNRRRQLESGEAAGDAAAREPPATEKAAPPSSSRRRSSPAKRTGVTGKTKQRVDKLAAGYEGKA